MYAIQSITQDSSFEFKDEISCGKETYYFYTIVLMFTYQIGTEPSFSFEETLNKVIALSEIPSGINGLNAACQAVAEAEGAAMDEIYQSYFSQQKQQISLSNLAEVKAKAMQAKAIKNKNENI